MSTEIDRQTEDIIREITERADEPIDVDPHADRTREFTHTSLSRQRWSWEADDQRAIDGIHQILDNEMLRRFSGAYQIMNDLYEIVREPEVTDQGEIITDSHGWTVWATTPSGAYVEDWYRLGHKDMTNFVFRIVTGLFAWEQTAAEIHADSLFAKAMWEEAVAIQYQTARETGQKTVEDRTQAARRLSQDQRLFGIFQAAMSRRADALVRNMTLLSQRLKDVLAA